MIKRLLTVLERAAQILFFGTVIFFISFPHFPKNQAGFSTFLGSLLLQGKNPFPEVGAEYALFKKLLPPNERVSFISDRPFSQYDPAVQKFYAAQSYLAPTVLTGPGERAAIVDCSNTEIADARMNEEGYRLLVPLANGKAIAVKRS